MSRFHPEFLENPTSVKCAAQEVLDDPYEKLDLHAGCFLDIPEGVV